MRFTDPEYQNQSVERIVKVLLPSCLLRTTLGKCEASLSLARFCDQISMHSKVRLSIARPWPVLDNAHSARFENNLFTLKKRLQSPFHVCVSVCVSPCVSRSVSRCVIVCVTMCVTVCVIRCVMSAWFGAWLGAWLSVCVFSVRVSGHPCVRPCVSTRVSMCHARVTCAPRGVTHVSRGCHVWVSVNLGWCGLLHCTRLDWLIDCNLTPV